MWGASENTVLTAKAFCLATNLGAAGMLPAFAMSNGTGVDCMTSSVDLDIRLMILCTDHSMEDRPLYVISEAYIIVECQVTEIARAHVECSTWIQVYFSWCPDRLLHKAGQPNYGIIISRLACRL